MSGCKSTIKDKWIRGESKEPIRSEHVASERTSHLSPIFSQPVGRGGKERERANQKKKKKRKEGEV